MKRESFNGNKTIKYQGDTLPDDDLLIRIDTKNVILHPFITFVLVNTFYYLSIINTNFYVRNKQQIYLN